MDQETVIKEEKQPWSLEMYLRKVLKGVIDPIAGFLLKVGLTPNSVTILGFLLSVVSAYFASRGNMLVAGLFLLVGAPLDVVDGTMARKQGEIKKSGAFFDSVIDRYSEMVVFLGLLIHFVNEGNNLASILVFIAAAGSILVSYVRARAEGLGLNGKAGFFGRVERLIVLVAGLLFNFPVIALWIIAIGANLTALLRFWFVRRQAN